MKRILILLVIRASAAAAAKAQTPFSFEYLVNTKCVGDPQLSPDGRYVAYTIGIVNKAENRTLTQIYRVNVDGSDQKQIDERGVFIQFAALVA